VILHEIEASNDTFDVGKQRRNRAPMEPNRATIWQTLQLGYEFNEAIVLRFTASEYDFSVPENFPIKGKLFSEGRVEKFEERNRLLELEIWREGRDHQNSYPVTNFM